jgi:hypothetical protein
MIPAALHFQLWYKSSVFIALDFQGFIHVNQFFDFRHLLPSKDSQKIRTLIFMISGETQKNQALRKLLSSPSDIWRAP